MLGSILLLCLAASGGDERLPGWARSLAGEEPARSAGAEDLLQEKVAATEVSGLTLNVGAHVRYAIPFGAADRSYLVYGNGLVVVDQYVSWADFFHAGWGLDLELDIFFAKNGPGKNREPGFNYGVT